MHAAPVHLGAGRVASSVDVGLLLDPLSMAFVLLVTFVGSLIHIYSVGYMDARPRPAPVLRLPEPVRRGDAAAGARRHLPAALRRLGGRRPGVVPADRLLEPQARPTPTAAKKAFVVNRVGDIGLSVAIMLMFATFGTVAFAGVFAGGRRRERGHAHRDRPAAAARRLRQVRAGPAAVLARRRDGRPDPGVGADPRRDHGHRRRLPHRPLRLRSSTARPNAQLAVVIVGAVTLLFGAIVGCAKDDIKKALAASTMSQIGYMMLAAGLGPVGYAFAIFHLLTHGFFKAGHVPRRRVGHARHERRGRHAPLRRAVATAMQITCVTFGLG